MFGQGDATLIQTPMGKSILIDGGGSDFSDFNVGKNTVMPYLLDRKIAYLDYIIISHFDTDHCGSALYIIENMKVKNVIIGNQYENNENLNKFKKIAKQKNINIKVVQSGDKVSIENNLYFDILWPDSEHFVSSNLINNNALVMKLNFAEKFSMLFTGDIEEEAEEELIKKYGNTKNLNQMSLDATILKVAHHGSKSSSTEEFLKLVNPRISLIGVGKDNLYGHPSDETIEKLKNIDSKIYRTDENGEIYININKKGKITKLNKFIK